MVPTQAVQIAATGAVGGGESPGTCHGVTLTPAAAKAIVVVRQGGASGTVLLTLQAPADGGSVTAGIPFQHTGGLYVTLTGAGALVTVHL